MKFSRRATLVSITLAIAMIALAGCFNPFSPQVAPVRGISETAPVPNSPQNLMRFFEWCWDHRAIAEYREVFTADFEFHFSARDSAGNPERSEPLSRENELDTAEHLFVSGSARQPPATRIELQFTSALVSRPDTRAGKTNSRQHRVIAPNVLLRIETQDAGNFVVEGVAKFFVCRQDAALIPDELSDRFSPTDSSRWFIERWEDETIPDAGGGGLRQPGSERSTSAGAPPPGSGGAWAWLRAIRFEPRSVRWAPAFARTDLPSPAAQSDLDLQVTWGYLQARYLDR